MKDRLAPAVIGAVFLVAAIALYTGRDARGPSARVSADAWYYHCYLVSLVRDRDLDFTDEYAVTGNWYRFGPTATGRPGNVFGIGPALFELPFYAAGAAIAAIAGQDTSGFGKLHVAVTLLSAPAFAVGALIFAVRLLRRRLGGMHVALWASVATFAAGPLVYYAVRQPGYAHPFAAFFTSWLLDAWDASYERRRTLATWLGLGALYGATALARPQLALWGIVLAAAAIDDLRRRDLGAPWRWLAGAAAALAVFSPQLVAWKVVYGAWWLVPQGPDFMVWTHPMWSEVLFSSRNGLLAWAPLYAIAGVGLIASVARHARIGGLLLAGTALQVVANGAVWDWWGGGSFGGRRFDSCLVPFAFGLGWLFSALSRRRAAQIVAGATATLCVVANLALAAVSHVFTLPEHGGQPVRRQLEHKLPAGLGTAVGALSSLVTLPARAAFAWRWGVDLDAYERIVGVHWLTEQYPGTGGPQKPTEARRPAGDEPYLIGFERTPAGARMRTDEATILVSLNRRHGPVWATLKTTAPVRATWDGRPLADAPTLALEPVERGVHELRVQAPPGTILQEVRLEVKPGTPP